MPRHPLPFLFHILQDSIYYISDSRMNIRLPVWKKIMHIHQRQLFRRINRYIGSQHTCPAEFPHRAVNACGRIHKRSHTAAIAVAFQIGIPEFLQLLFIQLIAAHQIYGFPAHDFSALIFAPTGQHLSECKVIPHCGKQPRAAAFLLRFRLKQLIPLKIRAGLPAAVLLQQIRCHHTFPDISKIMIPRILHIQRLKQFLLQELSHTLS